MVRERVARLMKERLETECEAAAREAMSTLRDTYHDDQDKEPRRPRRQLVQDQIRHSAFAWASSTVTNFISEILNAENPAAPGRLHRTGVERR